MEQLQDKPTTVPEESHMRQKWKWLENTQNCKKWTASICRLLKRAIMTHKKESLEEKTKIGDQM